MNGGYGVYNGERQQRNDFGLVGNEELIMDEQ